MVGVYRDALLKGRELLVEIETAVLLPQDARDIVFDAVEVDVSRLDLIRIVERGKRAGDRVEPSASSSSSPLRRARPTPAA